MKPSLWLGLVISAAILIVIVGADQLKASLQTQESGE